MTFEPRSSINIRLLRSWIILLLPVLHLGCATNPGNVPESGNQVTQSEKVIEVDLYPGIDADQLIGDGTLDFSAGRYEEGINKLKSAHLKGSPEAAHILGIAFRDWIPEADISKSIYWFRQAAEGSFANSYLELAKLYFIKDYGREDYKSARRWAEKASMAGIDTGTFILGDLYYFGLDVDRDLVKARELYEASLGGSRDSLFSAGFMQIYGEGGSIDTRSGVRNLTRYVENTRGSSLYDFTNDAYDILGSLYAHGDGIEQNSEKAFAYFSKSNGATYQSAGYLAVSFCLGVGTNPDQEKCEFHANNFLSGLEDDREARYWEEYVITRLCNHFLLEEESASYDQLRVNLIEGLGKLSKNSEFTPSFVFGLENALVFTGNLHIYKGMLQKLADGSNPRAMYTTTGMLLSQSDDTESRSKSFRYLFNAHYFGSEKALPFIENRIFPGWRYSAATNDELYFLISESVKTKGNRMVFAWNVVVNKPELNDNRYKFYVKQKNYYVYDCLNETSAFRSLVTYDTKGNVVNSRTADKLEHRPVVPGSIGEAMLENVCADLAGYQTEYSDGLPVSVGTGWPVVGGYVVTNYHVVQGANEISLFTKDGTRIAAEIAITDKVNDIALLRVPKSQDLPRPLKLADRGAQQGMQVANDWIPSSRHNGR